MCFLRILLVAAALCHVASAAAAAELLMFYRAGCSWCEAWEREIGPIYHKAAVARVAPLRRVDLDGPRLEGVVLKSPVRFTPTFVLTAENREIARIEGYPGEDFFWARLEQLVAIAFPRTE